MLGKMKLFAFGLLSLLLILGIPEVQAYGPLLQRGDLIYEGAFRVPKGNLGGQSTRYNTLGFGGCAIQYNPIRNSLFIFTYDKLLLELSIPEIINSTNLNELKTAEVLQPPVDITNGNWDNLTFDGSPIGNGGSTGGLLVYNGRLIGSAFGYYDGAYKGYRSHFYASLNWSQTGTNFHGMYRVGINPIDPTAPNGGFVGGYMCLIPPEWRFAFGGPALTGKGAISVISRSSYGPCAWVFNPDDLGVKDPVPAQMLVGYPNGHTTLGTYDGPSLYYNMGTEINGIVFPFGTSTIIFFGRHGLGKTGQGDTCYGEGTSDITLDGKEVPGTNGVIYCYDPVNNSKGDHAYPYVYRAWAYDAHDLLKVKKGEINPDTGEPYKPWDIKPYAIWNLDFPFAIENARILGAAYDPATQRIFISEYGGDQPGYEPYPLIQVFKVNVPNSGSPPGSPSNLRKLSQ